MEEEIEEENEEEEGNKCLEGKLEGWLVKERSKRASSWDSVRLRHGFRLDSTFGSVGSS